MSYPGNTPQNQPQYPSYPQYPPNPQQYPPNPSYPPQQDAGQYGEYGGQSAPSGYPQYPPNPLQYPPNPSYPPQPNQGGYPQYPAQSPYPPNPQYPPQQPLTPYGYNVPPQHQAPGQQYPGYSARQYTNPFAGRALVYGALSCGINVIGLFAHFYLIGVTAVFAIIYGFRALFYALRLPNRAGIGMAIGSIILGGVSILISIAGLALSVGH